MESKVKARPILFSAPMIRALLEGRKTQTRRLVKGYPKDTEFSIQTKGYYEDEIGWIGNEGGAHGFKFPYGKPGDLLWVRESFAGTGDVSDGTFMSNPHKNVWYVADNDTYIKTIRPSVHMPRWASRLTLEITDVGVERLQDITEEDAFAEGCFFTDYGRNCYHSKDDDDAVCRALDKYHPQKPGWAWKKTKSDKECLQSAVSAFGNLWNSINNANPWNANPWVWVLSFEVHHCNVDDFLKQREAA